MPACTPGLHVTGQALFVFVSSISSVHPHPTHLSAYILRPSNSFTLNKHISSRFVFICKQCSIRISSALSRMWHECLVCTCASVVARPGETPGAGRIWCVDNDSVYHFLILISLRLGCYQRKDRKAQSKQYTHRDTYSLGPMQRDRDVAKQTKFNFIPQQRSWKLKTSTSKDLVSCSTFIFLTNLVMDTLTFGLLELLLRSLKGICWLLNRVAWIAAFIKLCFYALTQNIQQQTRH